MSESKHTPGPWIAFSDEIDDHTNIVSIADRTRLVLVLPLRHKSEPDVRLIAAAPDLLEALEEAVKLFVIHDHKWFETAKSAIAKAKGQRS